MCPTARGPCVLTGLTVLAALTVPVAQAQDGDVTVEHGDAGGWHAPPSIGLSANTPGRPGRPATSKPGGNTRPSNSPAALVPLCPTVMCDAPGQTQDPAFMLSSQPLSTWCLGPLNNGHCPQPNATPQTPNPASASGPPDPVVLAQQAAQRLRLPLPTPRHSPDLRLPDGRPATVVGEHTWFWTAPEDWRPQTQRVQAGEVWAEVTAIPVRLSMAPGLGQPVTSCAGPGTPYERSFGLHVASPDCDVVYEQPSIDQPGALVTAEWSITWRVTWQGWTGSSPAGGELAPMTSRAPARFAVAEAQALRIR
ncbi:hypothetical protein SAMN05216215_1018126 [Saccharopolyspora shandongensis]|uniref:Uncharacterized protein n=1 Tax=Saccharopolyspora shandongensis TaxID=418495 RepID=A0A1H3GFB8_9PSEU|nr:hypothetical protein SAMN05216215_1018126 [Saccharopolyspora shandongensis]